MASEKLEIDVTADAKKATKELEGLQKTVDKLEKSEPEIEVTADDKASKVLDQVEKKAKTLATGDFDVTVQGKVDKVLGDLEKVGAEAKETAAAADALGRALGPELEAQADTTRIVGDLQKLGLTTEEITASADQLGAKLKELADIDVGGKIGGSLGTARGKMDELGQSADSSKSVMANMVGNTTQDLGALGGIAGSTGVAIGQMGEYMADALGSGEKLGSVLKNFGKVAGPLAAVAAAAYLIGNAMKSIEARKAFRTEQVDAFVESINEGEDAVAALATRLEEAGKIETPDLFTNARQWLGISGAIEDVSKKVADLGLTYETFAEKALEGPEAIEAWAKAQIAAGKSVEDVLPVMAAMGEAYEAHVKAGGKAATTTALAGDKARDAKADFKGAADALEKWTDETARAIEGAQAFSDAVGSIDYAAADLEGAVAGMSKFTEQNRGLVNIHADLEESFDGLQEAYKKNGKSLDVTTEKGRANQDAIEDVAKALDTRLAAAYVDADGDQATFAANAGKLAQDTLKRLQKELGLSDEQTEALADSLGLLPEDLETRYKLSGDEEAKLKLGLLQGAIDSLDKDVQAKVTQQIIVGDYQGALATVQAGFNRNPPTVPTEVEAPSTWEMLGVRAQMGAFFNNNPVPVKTVLIPAQGRYANGGTVGPGGGIAGEAGAELVRLPGRSPALLTGPAVVPPRTHVTSARRTRAILARTAAAPHHVGGTSNTYVTNNVIVPRIPTGRELARVSARWARVNGKG